MHLNAATIYEILSTLALLGGAALILKSRIPQQTITNQTQLIDTLEKRIKAMEDDAKLNHLTQQDNVRAIADLQGQIKVYKELPLRELANGIQEIGKTNQQILTTLQSSAIISPKDGVEATIKTGMAHDA